MSPRPPDEMEPNVKQVRLFLLTSSLCLSSATFGADRHEGEADDRENVMLAKHQQTLLMANGPITTHDCFRIPLGSPPIWPHLIGIQDAPAPPNMAIIRLTKFMAAVMGSDLQLSDEQLENVAQSKIALMDKIGSVTLQINSLERDLSRALVKDDIDATDIAELSKQLSAQRQVLDDAFVEHLTHMAKLLTVEQRRRMRLTMDRGELMPMKLDLIHPPRPFPPQ
jgi:hypothetical protein